MSVLIVYFKTHRKLVPIYIITSENAYMVHDICIMSHINNLITFPSTIMHIVL